MKSLREISTYFQDVTWNGNDEFTARSPLRRDSDPSLNVSIGNNGTVLFKDFGEPDNEPNKVIVENILQATGLTWGDISPEKEQKKDGKFDYKNIVAVYEYGHGIQKRRDIKKNFQWRYWNGNNYIYKQPDDVEPYHRGTPGETIFFFEGEKDVNNAADKLNLFAVSPLNGANLPTNEEKQKAEIEKYRKIAKDRNVIITPDNDDKGRNFVQRLAAELSEVAKTLRVVDLKSAVPELKEKGDISDVIDMYGPEKTLQVFSELVENTPEWVPFTVPEEDAFSELGLYSVSDLTEEEKQPPEFIIEGMIPVGLSFLSGAPKIRKSFFALQAAISVATGTPFLGHSTKQCDVVYLDLEGSKSRISERTERMSVQIPSNVYITHRVKERLANGLTEQLRTLHRQRPLIRLMIIDTFSRARGTVKANGANAYDLDVQLLEPIQRMAIEENIAIMFVHHDKKGAGFASDSFERLNGTMGISGSADAVLNLIAEGKRWDGRATLEYTPRDAKGGEITIVFDGYRLEWNPENVTKPDVFGNAVCKWLLDNPPEPRTTGDFISYDNMLYNAFHTYSNKAGEIIRESIEPFRMELMTEHNLAVQLGVKMAGHRGLRIINLV